MLINSYVWMHNSYNTAKGSILIYAIHLIPAAREIRLL